MNEITERDKIELSSYWAYQDMNNKTRINVNGKYFKIIDSYHSENYSNKNGSLDAVTFELLDKDKGTGQQFIAFQGTDGLKTGTSDKGYNIACLLYTSPSPRDRG